MKSTPTIIVFSSVNLLVLSHNPVVFNNVTGLRPTILFFLKKDSDTGVFLWFFAKFLMTPFLIEHLWCLLFVEKSASLYLSSLCNENGDFFLPYSQYQNIKAQNSYYFVLLYGSLKDFMKISVQLS